MKDTKKEQEEAISEFLKYVEKEIGQWGIYKDSPEIQERVKKDITKGLVKLPELTQTALIPKLLKSKIFTQSEIDKAFEIPIEERKEIDLSEIKNSKLSPENLLMGRGIMPEKGYMVISSSEKKGKTLFALNMGLCLISGNHFLDIPVIKKCRVFYIFSESNVYMLKDTMTKILKGLAEKEIEIKDKDLKNFLFYNAKVSKLIFTKGNREIPKLKESISRFRPDVVIIDPIGRIVDYTLNNAENIVTLANLMNEIRGCFWVLVHHSRKRGSEDIERITDPISRIRGSSNLANFAESVICIEPAGEKMPDNYKKIYFSVRRAYEPIPLQVKWDIENLNYDLMDTTDFKRPKKISVNDLVTFINDNFEGSGCRRDIVIAGAQKFKVSERYLYRLMIEAFDKGRLMKNEDKWEVKEKQVDLFK